MAIWFVDLPIKNGDFPYSYVKLPEGMLSKWRFLAGKTWKIIYKIGDVRDVHCQV
jgi:hypothetical protein